MLALLPAYCRHPIVQISLIVWVASQPCSNILGLTRLNAKCNFLHLQNTNHRSFLP